VRLGLRSHSRRQRRRIIAESNVWADARIERDIQTLLERDRGRRCRSCARRPDEISAVIEQHQRAGRKMLKLDVGERFRQSAAINRG
jgi:hypothetical protein